MSQLRWSSLAGLMVVVLAGCGGSKKSASTEPPSTEPTGQVMAACKGAPLNAAQSLPSKFPTLGAVTYTKKSTQGPTKIVEGYYAGDVKAAHDGFKAALGQGGYSVLFDELQAHDSEVSWKGHGRSGQVALREDCGVSNRTYVRITSRPQ